MSELECYRGEEYSPAPTSGSAAALATIDPARTAAQVANVEKFLKTVMRRGVHYGTIPGVDKPFLWKAGAELLGGLFSFGVRTKRDELLSYVDRAAERVEITVKAVVFSRSTGQEVWNADGFASSDEACFRRKACPVCSKMVKRDGQDKSLYACTSCDWSGKADQLGDALANDFGTTIRNVAARAEKRAKVRALAEATGATGFFLTPESWEQEEDAGQGNCPKCGVGTLVERQRKDGSGSFWACNNGSYDPKTRKRTGCQHIQNEPPGQAQDVHRPAADGASLNLSLELQAAWDLCAEQFERLGKSTEAQQNTLLARFAREQGIEFRGDRTTFTAEQVASLYDWLCQQGGDA